MNKEEILEKSRSENKNKDLYELEVDMKSKKYGAYLAVIIIIIFYLLELSTVGAINHRLMSILFAFGFAQSSIRAYHFKNKMDIINAVLAGLLTISHTIAHIFNLM